MMGYFDNKWLGVYSFGWKIFLEIVYWLIILIPINLAITGFVDWLIHPELSQMQIFLRIPQSFFWNFT